MDYSLIIKTLNEEGKVVALLTDTVYGLVCNAFDKKATEKIYQIKKRESKKPLSIFVKDISEVPKYVDESNLTKEADRIMKKYWPGALTIVFKKKDNSLDHITEKSSGIGIRIPKDTDLLYILSKIDFPLAQTSCNISGEEVYRDAESIRNNFGSLVDLVIDGGTVGDNLPSTVLSMECNEAIILRVGALKLDV